MENLCLNRVGRHYQKPGKTRYETDKWAPYKSAAVVDIKLLKRVMAMNSGVPFTALTRLVVFLGTLFGESLRLAVWQPFFEQPVLLATAVFLPSAHEGRVR